MLTACTAGTKLLDDPHPGTPTTPLAQASDESLHATLAWVIVRDGPGTWARNADWDEYLVTVRTAPGADIELLGVVLVDALGNRIAPRDSRRDLVEGTQVAKRRYEEHGLEIRAGWDPMTLAAAGAVTWYGLGAPLAVAAVSGSSGAAAAGLGVVVIAPVLLVSGVMRGVNNDRVNDEIQRRSTQLPTMLSHEEDTALNFFFPLTPAPDHIEVIFSVNGIHQTLEIDTRTPLAGLHLKPAS